MVMVFGRVTWFIHIFALILFAIVCTSLGKSQKEIIPNLKTCSEDRLFIIRSTHSTALVLDATNASQVMVQPYTGFRTQLWRFQRASAVGLFYIVNNYTGLFLDFRSDDSVYLAPKSSALSQQWFFGIHNNSGKVITAAKVANLDITGQRFMAGDPVGVWFDGDYPNQKWKAWEKL